MNSVDTYKSTLVTATKHTKSQASPFTNMLQQAAIQQVSSNTPQVLYQYPVYQTYNYSQPQMTTISWFSYKVPNLNPMNYLKESNQLITEGDNYLKEINSKKLTFSEKEKYFFKAVNLYRIALNKEPSDSETLHALAEAYSKVTDFYLKEGKINLANKNLDLAIMAYTNLCQICPFEHDHFVTLGELYEDRGKPGDYDTAISIFSSVTKKSPNNDYANRRLLLLENKKLAQTNPMEASVALKHQQSSNINAALLYLDQYAPPYIKDVLNNVKGIKFDEIKDLGNATM